MDRPRIPDGRRTSAALLNCASAASGLPTTVVVNDRAAVLFRAAMAALGAVMLAAAPASALKPERGYRAVPSDYGIVYEPMTVETPDSVSIRVWFYPAQDTTHIANALVGRLVPVPDSLKTPAPPPDATQEARRPTVVIASGDGGNMTQNILYAYHLFTRGMHVVTFDWRGFGESDPWPRDGSAMERDWLCYAEFLTDYAAVLDAIEKRPDVDPERIGLLGYSTGAYLSFSTAAARPEIAAFAGRALLTSFEETIPILAEVMPDRSFRAPPDYPDSLVPIAAAGRVRCPVFLIVGENDVRTPPWMTARIASKVGGPKEVWVVPGADHGGGKGPEFVSYPEFFVRVGDFFEASFKGASDLR